MPKKVDAKFLSIIKGEEDGENVAILCNPKSLRPDVAKSKTTSGNLWILGFVIVVVEFCKNLKTDGLSG